jgi:hypothetical protein
VADWATISSLATAAGTLVLAVATFASVRSAHRSAGVTERALMAQLRPVLVHTRITDPPEKIGFMDGHFIKAEGQRAVIDLTDEAIYMAFTVRNVGAGIGVLDRWDLRLTIDALDDDPRDPESFNRLTRDIYIPAGDIGFWQGAMRDPSDLRFGQLRDAVEAGERITIDVLYEDHEGGQRTITRFGLTPTEDGRWMTAAARHWNLDRDDPR